VTQDTVGRRWERPGQGQGVVMSTEDPTQQPHDVVTVPVANPRRTRR
jgi:hypothetical protein